jgi:ADP-heptose:LPS heptosyltransferase
MKDADPGTQGDVSAGKSRRVLCIAEGQLGDLLLLTPAVRAVKESFPSSFLSVLVLQRRRYDVAPAAGVFSSPASLAGSTSVVLRNDQHVDDVKEIDRSRLRELSGFRRLRSEFEIVRWLRRQKFDTVICTFPEDRFFLWAFASGARKRVGEAGGKLAALLTHKIVVRRREVGVLRYYCALAEAAGARITSYATTYTLSPSAETRAEQTWREAGLETSRRVVAIHPGASGPHRVWPPENFAAVIGYLQSQKGFQVVLCGSAFDAEAVEEVKRLCAVAPRVIMTGDGVDILAGVLRRSALLISNDSGPRHLAVALGVPSIAFFPKFGDLEWKVYDDDLAAGGFVSREPCPACPPDSCRNVIPPGARFGSYCLRALPVDQVIGRAAELLDRVPA